MTPAPDTPFTEGLDGFSARLEEELSDCSSLEQAGQRFCDGFYATFHDFTALVRVFGTFPYGRLPPDDRTFAGTYLAHGGERPDLDERTPVLTLLGTAGIESAWCARTTSRDHRAIPLLSDDFVDDIPMIARLLSEIGFPRLTSNRSAWQFVTRDIVDVNGLFFVGDARTTTDERGRPIIPSLNFVERYGIKTVFGFGGPYTSSGTFLTAIVFARRTLERSTASRFAPLIANLKDATRTLIDRDAIFSESAS